MQKNKKRNRIIIFSSTGILLLAVILTIVFVSIHSNEKPKPIEKPLPDSVKEGVHFASYDYILGPPTGTLRVASISISYAIDIEKDTYDYDEEFIIRYRITSFQPERETGDLKIKFISDNFTFLSPTEYLYKDCKEFGITESPVDIHLRVKATKQTSIIDHILVLLDFDMSEEYKQELIRRRKEDEEERGKYYNFYNDFKYYYNNDFQLMQFIYHINDELGTILIDESNHLTIANPRKESPRLIGIAAFDLAMYKSLNRLYEQNLITKKEYVDRIFRCASENRPYVIHLVAGIEDHKASYTYSSNNFRAFFSIDEKCLTYGNNITPNDYAKQLITIAYEEGVITEEEYNTEINLIDSSAVKQNYLNAFDFPSKIIIDYTICYALIPFDDFQSYWCDYVIRK